MTPAAALAAQSFDKQDVDDVRYLQTLFAEAVQDEGMSNATVIMALAKLIAAMDAAHPRRGQIPQALVVMVQQLHVERVGEGQAVGHA